MRTTTACPTGPTDQRDELLKKRKPTADERRIELSIELTRLIDAGCTDTPAARTLRSQVSILNELLSDPGQGHT